MQFEPFAALSRAADKLLRFSDSRCGRRLENAATIVLDEVPIETPQAQGKREYSRA